MRFLVKNCILSVIWVFMSERITLANLAIGFFIGWLLLLYLNPEEELDIPFPNPWKLFLFFLFFVKELIVANIRVAYYVISPTVHLKPGIVKIPLDAKTDLEITLLSNAITLTPGSMTVDVSDDKKYIFLHVMHLEQTEKFKREIKEGFERRLLELLR